MNKLQSLSEILVSQNNRFENVKTLKRVLRYSTNKVYTKTTYPSGEIREKVGEETETIDISGNNEGYRTEGGEREREKEVNAPEARTSQNPTGVSANPLFLGSLWFKLRGGREEEWLAKLYGRNHGRRERGQVQVARSSSSPPTGKIYSFHAASHNDPV